MNQIHAQATASDLLDATHPYYHFNRADVRLFVPIGARRILDVGCAAGEMGAALKADRPLLRVEGVEVVASVAETARGRLDQVHVGAIEAVAPQLQDGAYDAIICADVLEHTIAEPVVVLRQLRPKLAAGGALIASIPNVRHVSVLRQLLEGRFDYTDLGILDRTHLRFFTRMTVLQLFAWSGFAPQRMISLRSGGAVPVEMAMALSQIGLVVDSLVDESGAYQYLLSCQAAPPLSPVRDDATLRRLLSETVEQLDEATRLFSPHGGEEERRSTWEPLALRAAQMVAVLAEATGPTRLAPSLYASFARIFSSVLLGLCGSAEPGRSPTEIAAGLSQAQTTLRQLSRAL